MDESNLGLPTEVGEAPPGETVLAPLIARIRTIMSALSGQRSSLDDDATWIRLEAALCGLESALIALEEAEQSRPSGAAVAIGSGSVAPSLRMSGEQVGGLCKAAAG